MLERRYAETETLPVRDKPARTEDSPALTPGQTLIGKYRIEKCLGTGGTATVYLAQHLKMERDVAIKVPHARLREPHQVERFRREARLAFALDHPNIVRVLDCDTEGHIHFIVMEYIEGSDIHELIEMAGVVPEALAYQTARAALNGLAALHSRGIVHGDIKPANLLIRRADGQIKVADFGLARVVGPEQGLQRRMHIAGTPGYMAPEVMKGGVAGKQADIFSLGATLYHMTCGRPPWRTRSTTEPCNSIANSFLDADSGDAQLSGGIRVFLSRCLAERPTERYADATDALSELDRLQPSVGTSAPGGDRVVRNRCVVVCSDDGLSRILFAMLGSTHLLMPASRHASVNSPQLNASLPAIDAILIDISAGKPLEIEEFLGRTRERYPRIVFFLIVQGGLGGAAFQGLRTAWQKRLAHYFTLNIDTPMSQLPRKLSNISKAILFDQKLESAQLERVFTGADE